MKKRMIHPFVYSAYKQIMSDDEKREEAIRDIHFRRRIPLKESPVLMLVCDDLKIRPIYSRKKAEISAIAHRLCMINFMRGNISPEIHDIPRMKKENLCNLVEKYYCALGLCGGIPYTPEQQCT